MQKSHAYARRLLAIRQSIAERLRFSIHFNLVSIMKISFYWCLLILITTQTLIAKVTSAQSIRETTISFETQNTSLKTALKKLEKATNYSLAYPSEKVGRFNSISISKGTRTVEKTEQFRKERTIFIIRNQSGIFGFNFQYERELSFQSHQKIQG